MLEDLLNLIFRSGISGTRSATEESRIQSFALFLFMLLFCIACAVIYSGTSSIVFWGLALLTGIAAIVILIIEFRR